MATSLDLQEQEQLDALKAFWKQYGNLITWVLILALGAFAAWNGWNWWQRSQATKAAAMYEELDRAVAAGDVERTSRIFGDLKERYARTVFAQQGAMAAAKLQFEKGQIDAAKASLGWVAANAGEDEYRTMARLSMADLLLQAKQYDEALKQLDDAKAPSFEALVADRRGDVLLAQGKADAARAAYQTAWAAMDPKLDYRRLIEAKLVSLAAPPQAAASAASGAAR
ncbi:MAG: tetratricopeptide repeat protein [Rubrivivax sp.]|jgi:predicted negative regulator of RcsB-dependent stress response|nr:tetratricopeptide repeat protein [Rubrivivax sp.]MBK8526630.1 tetratricopeptide repeat protein [Rubrivivax sp.]